MSAFRGAAGWLRPHSKAIAGGLGAGLVAYLQLRGGGVTGPEWGEVATAALAGGGITWLAPANRARP